MAFEHISSDPFEKILERLDIFSRYYCGITIKSWRSSLNAILEARPRFLSTPDHMPPSIFGPKDSSPDNAIFSYAELSSDRSYQVSVPGLAGQRVLGAGEGWLVSAPFCGPHRFHYLLMNPLTKEEIILPRKSSLPGQNCGFKMYCNFKKVIICRPPDHVEGFFLVGLPFFAPEKISFLRPNDVTWIVAPKHSKGNNSADQYEDAVLYRNLLFVLTNKAFLYAYPVSENTMLGEPAALSSGNGIQLGDLDKSLFILTHDDCLLMVTRVNGNSRDRRPTRMFIHKSRITGGPVTWVLVSNIGDISLFLGHGNSVALRVGSGLSRIKPNNLYFTERFNLRNYTDGTLSNVGVYGLSTRLYQPFAYHPQVQHPVWMRPSLTRTDGAAAVQDQEEN